ncbi:MAG TPA: isoprenylcysteine carboxylmethyltransferase family protein [Rhizomicrobium sp.]|jgi:protein-S-isoprenylcysteine O-methyltransferase Ste14|nr:isoprenylcysteine carboxylmethyltransferase family protein [Rhizomicrobium sp.]
MSPQQALYLVWVVWGVTWTIAAAWSARSTARLPIRRELFYRLLLVGGILLLFFPLRRLPNLILWQLSETSRWACVGLAIVGFGFCWWARIHLGLLWSANVARKADHRVIETGPYGIVRHPIYTGIILASIAVLVERGTALAILGVCLVILSWYLKARLEESYLRAELGVPAYDAYAARVPMLVPLVKF